MNVPMLDQALVNARALAAQSPLKRSGKGQDNRTGKRIAWVEAADRIKAGRLILPQVGLVLRSRDESLSDGCLSVLWRLTHAACGDVDEWTTVTPLDRSEKPALTVGWARTHALASALKNLLWPDEEDEAPDPASSPPESSSERAATQPHRRPQNGHAKPLSVTAAVEKDAADVPSGSVVVRKPSKPEARGIGAFGESIVAPVTVELGDVEREEEARQDARAAELAKDDRPPLPESGLMSDDAAKPFYRISQDECGHIRAPETTGTCPDCGMVFVLCVPCSQGGGAGLGIYHGEPACPSESPAPDVAEAAKSEATPVSPALQGGATSTSGGSSEKADRSESMGSDTPAGAERRGNDPEVAGVASGPPVPLNGSPGAGFSPAPSPAPGGPSHDCASVCPEHGSPLALLAHAVEVDKARGNVPRCDACGKVLVPDLEDEGSLMCPDETCRLNSAFVDDMDATEAERRALEPALLKPLVDAPGEAEAAAWNESHPIGTRVRYWAGVREGEGVESTTRSTAWAISGHASVQVEGKAGSIALSHVEALPSLAPLVDALSRVASQGEPSTEESCCAFSGTNECFHNRDANGGRRPKRTKADDPKCARPGCGHALMKGHATPGTECSKCECTVFCEVWPRPEVPPGTVRVMGVPTPGVTQEEVDAATARVVARDWAGASPVVTESGCSPEAKSDSKPSFESDQARSDRLIEKARRWGFCKTHECKRTIAGKAPCVECGEPFVPGQTYRQGLAASPPGEVIRRKSSKPVGSAHAECVALLAAGRDPKAKATAASGGGE